MCLTTKQGKPTVLDENMIVYKILDKGYETPFRHKTLLPNILYDTFDEIETVYHKFEDYFIVGGGFFHAYVNVSNALSCRDELINFLHRTNISIYKALIPKGTKCYFGINGDIAAKQIKILEKCV